LIRSRWDRNETAIDPPLIINRGEEQPRSHPHRGKTLRLIRIEQFGGKTGKQKPNRSSRHDLTEERDSSFFGRPDWLPENLSASSFFVQKKTMELSIYHSSTPLFTRHLFFVFFIILDFIVFSRGSVATSFFHP
jgi:hypothetical protein